MSLWINLHAIEKIAEIWPEIFEKPWELNALWYKRIIFSIAKHFSKNNVELTETSYSMDENGKISLFFSLFFYNNYDLLPSPTKTFEGSLYDDLDCLPSLTKTFEWFIFYLQKKNIIPQWLKNEFNVYIWSNYETEWWIWINSNWVKLIPIDEFKNIKCDKQLLFTPINKDIESHQKKIKYIQIIKKGIFDILNSSNIWNNIIPITDNYYPTPACKLRQVN